MISQNFLTMKKIKFLLFACLAVSMFLLASADAQAQSAKGEVTNLQQATQEAKTARQAKIQQSTNKKNKTVQKGELKAMKAPKTKAQSLRAVKSDVVKKVAVPVNRSLASKIASYSALAGAMMAAAPGAMAQCGTAGSATAALDVDINGDGITDVTINFQFCHQL